VAADDSGDVDTIRAAWGELRSTILPAWIRERPGTRPYGWWRFDAPPPARRERIDGGIHPHDNAARKLHIAKSDREDFWRRAYGLHFGLPGLFIFPHDKDLYDDWWATFRGGESKIWEPEWSFLVRHNLLLPEDSP
jgi:hypothetical protein